MIYRLIQVIIFCLLLLGCEQAKNTLKNDNLKVKHKYNVQNLLNVELDLNHQQDHDLLLDQEDRIHLIPHQGLDTLHQHHIQVVDNHNVNHQHQHHQLNRQNQNRK